MAPLIDGCQECFLDQKEEIYMTPLQGYFVMPSADVCRLKQSLYGLKQAPWA